MRAFWIRAIGIMQLLPVLGCNADQPVVVSTHMPASIEIRPDSSVTLTLGDRRQLTVVVRDVSDNVIGSVGLPGSGDAPSKFRFESRGPSWVAVDSTGTVTGVAAGSAVVIVTFLEAAPTLVDLVLVRVTAPAP